MKHIFLVGVLFISAAATAAPYYNMYVESRTEQNTGAGTPNSCLLQLGEYDLTYAIEWQVSDADPLWTETTPFIGHKVVSDNTTDCSNKTSCFVHGERKKSKASMFINDQGVKEYFQSNKPYYFAARQFIDSNNNGVRDAGEFTRDWSVPARVTNGWDYNHRCTFNTFPAQ